VSTPNTQAATLPFGKHKGKLLDEIPGDYLCWLLTSCKLSTALRATVETELLLRGIDLPETPAPRQPRPCSRCGSEAFRFSWQEDRRGGRRIRQACADCNGFISFMPVCEPFISEANASASPAAVLDALLLAEQEGVELASDGKTVWIRGDRRRASQRLQDAVRQNAHLLAGLLGRTRGT
jgi:hypothetical protein